MIYRTKDFALTQAAVDQMRYVEGEYLSHFPDDPPVAAGIFTAAPLVNGIPGGKGIGMGFWRRSEFPEDSEDWKRTVNVAGIDVLFGVPMEDRRMFEDAVIDYSPDKAFFLRPD